MNLSSSQKGMLLIVIGLVILLAYNLFNIGINTIIVVAASGLIVGGFFMADGLNKIKKLFGKK